MQNTALKNYLSLAAKVLMPFAKAALLIILAMFLLLWWADDDSGCYWRWEKAKPECQPLDLFSLLEKDSDPSFLDDQLQRFANIHNRIPTTQIMFSTFIHEWFR